MSPLADAVSAWLDPDRGVAIGMVVALVAAVVCAPGEVRRRWWDAITRCDR